MTHKACSPSGFLLYCALAGSFLACASGFEECNPGGPVQSECDASVCSSDFLMERFCSFYGIPATVLGFEADPLWVTRLNEFNACTGARVSITYNGPDGEGDEDFMAADLLADIGSSGEGAGIFDGYVVQPPWLPSVQAGLENLSPRIAASSDVRWLDVNAASRQVVSVNNSVRALPLDVDYIAIGWRQDVFEKWNISGPPNTIDEMVALSEFFNGKDHNGDGEPDWGFCLTPQANYFYAFVAPLLQTSAVNCSGNPTRCTTERTSENIFFDPITMEPLINNPAFRHAVDLYDRLLRSSNCQDQLQDPATNKYAAMSGGKCDRKTAFPTGKCAGLLSLPGTMTRLLQSIEPRNVTTQDANGEVTTTLWQPTTSNGEHYGRRSRFPGTTHVWDRQDNSLKACSAKEGLCPKNQLIDGQMVNFAAFFAEGGEAYAIRAKAPQRKKDILFELFVWFSTLPPSMVPLSGSYRLSHIADESTADTNASSNVMPAQMAKDLRELLAFYFLDDVSSKGNPVKDLFIPGYDKYMSALSQQLHDNFLLSSDYFFGVPSVQRRHKRRETADSARRVAFDARYQAFVSALARDLHAITDSFGPLSQLQAWRNQLNLPYLTDVALCSQARPDKETVYGRACAVILPELAVDNDSNSVSDIVVPLSVCIAVLVLVLLVMLVLIRRNRTRVAKQTASEIQSKVRAGFCQNFKYAPERDEFLALLEKLAVKPGDTLERGPLLGMGHFGVVHSGTLRQANGKSRRVAIKELRLVGGQEQEQESLVFEAHLQALLMRHKYVLALVAVSLDTVPMRLMSELMTGGSLLSMLRNLRQRGRRPKPESMLRCSLHLADALQFLQRNHVVHRDLAARNCLVGETVEDVRISDFGMSRRNFDKDYYRAISGDNVPVKWMPLEAIQFKTFTHASDVWSFGVLMWELYTLGASPWAELSAIETVCAIAGGQRLPRPEGCPDCIDLLLKECWEQLPENRPSFYRIFKQLGGMLGVPELGRSYSNHSGSFRPLPLRPSSSGASAEQNNSHYVYVDSDLLTTDNTVTDALSSSGNDFVYESKEQDTGTTSLPSSWEAYSWTPPTQLQPTSAGPASRYREHTLTLSSLSASEPQAPTDDHTTVSVV